jgi:hypothetical protein
MSFDPPTIAQAIEVIFRHHANGITHTELAEAIFGPRPDRLSTASKSGLRLACWAGLHQTRWWSPARYFKGRPGPSES